MHFILLYHTTGVMQNKACVDIIGYAVMLSTIELGVYRNTYP